MCTNNSSGGRGGAGGGGGGDNNDYSSPACKKQRREKIPKRGPGVAELEKILREQSNQDDQDKLKNEELSSTCFVSPFSSSYNPQSSIFSSSNSIPGKVPFVPNQKHFPPPPQPLTSPNGNGVHYGTNGGLLPAMCSASEENAGEVGSRLASGFPFLGDFVSGSNQMCSSPVWMPRKNSQNPHSLSGYSNSSMPSSAGFYPHLEPPSSQIPCYPNNIFVQPEEHKIAGTKQPSTYSFGNLLPPSAPQIHHHFPQHSSHINKLDKSTSPANQNVYNFLPVNITSRDIDYGVPNSNKYVADCRASNDTARIFGFQLTNQTSEMKFPQVSNEDSYQRLDSSGSVHEKPFYNFLPLKGQNGVAETSLDLSHLRGEAKDDAIDLDLKLQMK